MTRAIRFLAAALTLGACLAIACLAPIGCSSQSDTPSQAPASAQTDVKPKQVTSIVIVYCDS
jgi:hypothetical protein